VRSSTKQRSETAQAILVARRGTLQLYNVIIIIIIIVVVVVVVVMLIYYCCICCCCCGCCCYIRLF
jgi:cell division protein FtsL